jgi:hypothetical protein
MFNPLLADLTSLKDADVDAKISELQKKYSIVARTGNGNLCSQILVALEGYRFEQQRRYMEKTNIVVRNKNKDLDDLINVN